MTRKDRIRKQEIEAYLIKVFEIYDREKTGYWTSKEVKRMIEEVCGEKKTGVVTYSHAKLFIDF